MKLTKKLLGERLKALETQKLQAIGQVNAIEGGLITIRGLLSDLDREEDSGEADNKSASPAGE